MLAKIITKDAKTWTRRVISRGCRRSLDLRPSSARGKIRVYPDPANLDQDLIIELLARDGARNQDVAAEARRGKLFRQLPATWPRRILRIR